MKAAKKLIFTDPEGKIIKNFGYLDSDGNYVELGENLISPFLYSINHNTQTNICTIKLEDTHIYSTNFQTPPIPPGYSFDKFSWNNGYTISRIKDNSTFIWVPVGCLSPNGTLDNSTFSEKFGRRNNGKTLKYSEDTKTDEFKRIFESILKYGGFYISKYPLSINKLTGLPSCNNSLKSFFPRTFNDAKRTVESFERNSNVTSHLPFGSHYDSLFEVLYKLFESNPETDYSKISKEFSKKHPIFNISNFDNGYFELSQEYFLKESNDCKFYIARGKNHISDSATELPVSKTVIDRTPGVALKQKFYVRCVLAIT